MEEMRWPATAKAHDDDMADAVLPRRDEETSGMESGDTEAKGWKGKSLVKKGENSPVNLPHDWAYQP